MLKFVGQEDQQRQKALPTYECAYLRFRL
jgi:hypothetical protein